MLNSFTKIIFPWTIDITTYLRGIVVYNAIYTFNDSNKMLKLYNSNNLNKDEEEIVKDKMSAVKYGCDKNFETRIVKSITWPILLCTEMTKILVFIIDDSEKKGN